MSPDDVIKEIDQFNLDFGLDGFDSENLERRLTNLTLIISAVERAMPSKEEKDKNILQFLRRAGIPTSRQNSEEEKKEKPKPIHPSFIIQWLEKTDFVKTLLTKKSHPEEIKQGILIFRFLAINKLLNTEQIDLIWSMQVGKHESVKNTIFDSLILLAEDVSVDHIKYIQDNINKIDDKDHDFETLRFISQFTPICIEKDCATQGSLDTLYKLAMELNSTQKIHESVSSGAFDHLVKILKLNSLQSKRISFILTSIENIKSNQSIIPSLKLIQELLKYFPQRKRKKLVSKDLQTRKSIIEHINEKNDLIDLLLNDIKQYKETVKDISKKKYLKKNKKLDKSHFSHIDNIRIRLGFLEYILTNSSLLLNSNQIDIFWNSLVKNSLHKDEKIMAFDWLENALRTSSQLEESAIHNLFVTQMTKMDFKRLSFSGYNLFEKFFLYLNEKNSRIKRLDYFTRNTTLNQKEIENNFIVNHQIVSELHGIDNLWIIALDAKDSEINKKAIQCLNMLHQNVPSETQKGRYILVRENFVSRCLDHLEDAISTEPPNLRHVECCIQVLKVSFKIILFFNKKKGYYYTISKLFN